MTRLNYTHEGGLVGDWHTMLIESTSLEVGVGDEAGMKRVHRDSSRLVTQPLEDVVLHFVDVIWTHCLNLLHSILHHAADDLKRVWIISELLPHLHHHPLEQFILHQHRVPILLVRFRRRGLQFIS